MRKAFIANDGQQFSRASSAVRHDAMTEVKAHVLEFCKQGDYRSMALEDVVEYLYDHATGIKLVVDAAKEASSRPDYTFEEVRDFIVANAYLRTEEVGTRDQMFTLVQRVWGSITSGNSTDFANAMHGDLYHLVLKHFGE